MSYAYHYRNLDSTEFYAHKAYMSASGYDAGKAEALNNLAFVRMARMDYRRAAELLDSAIATTDNQVELMIAEIQYLRLCQRQSHNKLFYVHQEKAKKYHNRIKEEIDQLDSHQLSRLVYAESEYYINSSAYYYYVGLEEPSILMMKCIDPDGDIQKDTAQYLNYLYNVGAGGIITGENADVVASEEFDYLTKCYLLSRQCGYVFWEAQSLQAISQHLLSSVSELTISYRPFLNYINVDNVADTLLAGNLAQRSLDMFVDYKDVYQIAGGYRTLASCYWQIKDYPSALICLNNALNADTTINRAPDLVASIREQLCLAYSALDDKVNSDINRNYYLDLQEQTRQDKQLEARADQLDTNAREMNFMLLAVVLLITLLVYILVYFVKKRKHQDAMMDIGGLLEPLKKWRAENEERMRALEDHLEEIDDQTRMVELSEEKNKMRNLEQRAKLSLVNSITPFIDRIINELYRLRQGKDGEALEKSRLGYVAELSDVINEYNAVLTRWIQLRHGSVSLHIESFGLDELFDIIAKAKMGFALRGLELIVEPTSLVVKADKTLTLFMINTIADNAKKFTPSGGKVVVKAADNGDSVEIVVEDTGCGMDKESCERIFDNKHVADDGTTRVENHGFGLLNCKGIIENYKKISRIFSVCRIGVDSEIGKGSRFSFTLPKGVTRFAVALCMLLPLAAECSFAAGTDGKPTAIRRNGDNDRCLKQASQYADSAYYSNINGTYSRTISFADSCVKYLNEHNKETHGRNIKCGHMVLYTESAIMPSEIDWFHKGVKTDYSIILDIRNETAVAALALHEWDLYQYNNKAYTRLFHECYADSSLPDYVRSMERSESNKGVAIVILVLLLASIPPIYYLVYYRHLVYYRTCVEKIHGINEVLLSHQTDLEKLKRIHDLTGQTGSLGISVLDKVIDDIVASLRHSSESAEQMKLKIEYASDEFRKAELENNKTYICNSVLDNCLSALKHETMYFPSRIKQLIDGGSENIDAAYEVAAYYKQLYSLLSAQAMRQVEAPIVIDRATMRYMLELLKKSNSGIKPVVLAARENGAYVTLALYMESLKLDKSQQQQMFTPLTTDVGFLICKQIVREIGERTNMRGCGIEAVSEDNIEITIPKKIWNNLM